MRIILLFSILLFNVAAIGQQYILPDGEYMDITVNTDSSCKDENVYYYQVGGKYSKTSATLLAEVQSFLKLKTTVSQGSGYITFQFQIDCAGKRMKRTKLLQTTVDYKAYHFDNAFINELYEYFNTLNDWPIAKGRDGRTYSYKAFITFKIKDGKVINIIP